MLIKSRDLQRVILETDYEVLFKSHSDQSFKACWQIHHLVLKIRKLQDGFRSCNWGSCQKIG